MPGPTMLLYVTILARMVPLLLLTSVLLIGTRFLHDRISRPPLRIAALAIFLALTMSVVVGYAVPMSSLVGAELAYGRGDWELADRRFTIYRRWGGRFNTRMDYEWGMTLANLRRWSEAQALLQRVVNAPPELTVPDVLARFNLGAAQWMDGRDTEAEETLKQLPPRSAVSNGQLYILGRLKEKQGDNAQALVYYQTSLTADPTFRPSFYQLIRHYLLLGRPDIARLAMRRFAALNPGIEQDPLFLQIGEVVDRGGQLEDREFFFTSD